MSRGPSWRGHDDTTGPVGSQLNDLNFHTKIAGLHDVASAVRRPLLLFRVTTTAEGTL